MKRKKIAEKYTGKELAEAFIFRNDLGERDDRQIASDIAAAREKIKAGSHKDQTLHFRLLQLKYQIEDYISKPFNERYTFGFFLKNYVDVLAIKRYQFAKEISIDETYLSQLINRHRLPSEEIMIRLELHSRNLIKALLWFKLLEKERENEIDTDRSMRAKEKKFVKRTVVLN